MPWPWIIGYTGFALSLFFTCASVGGFYLTLKWFGIVYGVSALTCLVLILWDECTWQKENPIFLRRKHHVASHR